MATGPKWSRAALDVINNTYVIRNGLLYEYYPISVLPYKETDGFMRLEISPGVMAPGIAIVGKQLFEVSLDDLLRRKINVSKKHRSAADDNIGSKLPTKKSKGSKSTETNPVKQRLGTVSGDQVSKNADMAWENQVESLLETFLAKEGEEFQITSTTQSRQVDANSPIPDIFEDIELG